MSNLLSKIKPESIYGLHSYFVPMVVCVHASETIIRQMGSLSRLDLLLIYAVSGLAIVFIVSRLVTLVPLKEDKRYLSTLILVVVIFSYNIIGKIYERAILSVLNSNTKSSLFIFPILVVAFVVFVIYMIIRLDFVATSFNKYIFIASLSFLVLQFYNVVKRLTIDTNVSLDESVAVRGSSVSLDLPDIYYLIVDAYTSDASLKKYFSYSNDLNEQLKTRGFYCTSKGKSNYPLTYPSLASSLNMSYINSSEMILGFEGQEDLKKMIRANKLYNVLQANEYNLVNLSHIFNLNGPGSIPRKPESLAYTSIYQKAIFYPLLQRYVEQKIVQNMKRPGKSLADSDIRNDIAYIYYQYNNFVYKELAQDANLDTHPKFVFAHFMDTHAPFVYTATGTYKNDDYFFQTISDYLIQVEQLNKKLIDLVDILKKSQRKKVIIIQADHGSHLFGSQETFDIQNSYYFSDEDYKMLYPSISPVNTFRVVLNKYFGQNLEMLADNQVTLSY